MAHRIVILGATGNIGSKIARILAAKGHNVTGVARDKSKFDALGIEGPSFAQADAKDTEKLQALLAEADAAFLMIPPSPTSPDPIAHSAEIGESILAAVKGSGLKKAVNLSSFGGEFPSGTGPIVMVHQQEERLNAVEGLDVVHLRPAYFFENELANLGMAQGMGMVARPAAPHTKLPAIATADIAERAAEWLDKADFKGKQVDLLLGDRDYTYAELTSILGKAIGKPELPCVEVSAEQAKAGMVQAGLSEAMADLYIEMNGAFRPGGLMDGKYERTERNTTPTRFEDFVASHPAFKAHGAEA